MTMAWAALIPALAGVVVAPTGSRRKYETWREALLAAGFAGAFFAWITRGPVLGIARPEALMAFLITVYLVAASALSVRRGVSWNALARYLPAMFFGLVVLPLVPLRLGVGLILSAGVVNALAVLFTRRIPEAGCAPPGLAGNPNWAGACLAPCVFLALLAGSWFPPVYAAAGLVAAAVWKTECRASVLGVLCGLALIAAFFSVALIFVAALLAALFCLRHPRALNTSSIHVRSRIWRFAVSAIKARPFFGYGPWAVRAYLGPERTKNGIVYFDGLHNVGLQAAADGGVIHLCLLMGLVGGALAYGMGSGSFESVALVAAMTCMVVNGMFLHILSIPMIAVVFWFLAGSLLRAPAWGLSVPPTSAWILGLAVAVLFGLWAVLSVLHDFAFWAGTRSSGEGHKQWLAVARALRPGGSAINQAVARVYLEQERDPGRALFFVQAALRKWDGETPMEALYVTAGNCCFHAGEFGPAALYYVTAQRYQPQYGPAAAGLLMLKNSRVKGEVHAKA